MNRHFHKAHHSDDGSISFNDLSFTVASKDQSAKYASAKIDSLT